MYVLLLFVLGEIFLRKTTANIFCGFLKLMVVERITKNAACNKASFGKCVKRRRNLISIWMMSLLTKFPEEGSRHEVSSTWSRSSSGGSLGEICSFKGNRDEVRKAIYMTSSEFWGF